MARTRYQQGSVVRRGTREPMWYGRFWEPVVRDGKVVRSYRSERLGLVAEMTEKQAKRALEPFLRAVNDPTFKPKHKMTLDSFITLWKERVLEAKNGPKPSSILNFKLHLSKHISPALGMYELDKIDAELLQQFISKIDLSPKTVRNIFATLRMVLKSSWKWSYFQGDLTRILENVNLPEFDSEPRVFTAEESQAIIQEAKGPLQLFFLLAAETGARAGELTGLRVCDVLPYGQGGMVNVEQSVWRGEAVTLKTKNSKRQIPISSDLYAMLKTHIGKRTEGYLFVTRNNTPWDASLVVTRKLHPILKKLNIEQAGLHAFRHMNGSLMHSLGAPLKVAQERLGHSDVATTLKIYTHTSLSSKAPVSVQIGKTLNPDRTQAA